MKIIVCIAALISIAAGAADIQEGLYEISVRAELGGMPVSDAPMIVRQCVSQQSMQQLMSQVGGTGACNVSDFEQSGSQARFDLSCSSPLNLSGTGETQLSGDEFSGRMDLSVQMGGDQRVPMVQKFTGKRVGECQ
jgi:hypothetical protein